MHLLHDRSYNRLNPYPIGRRLSEEDCGLEPKKTTACRAVVAALLSLSAFNLGYFYPYNDQYAPIVFSASRVGMIAGSFIVFPPEGDCCEQTIKIAFSLILGQLTFISYFLPDHSSYFKQQGITDGLTALGIATAWCFAERSRSQKNWKTTAVRTLGAFLAVGIHRIGVLFCPKEEWTPIISIVGFSMGNSLAFLSLCDSKEKCLTSHSHLTLSVRIACLALGALGTQIPTDGLPSSRIAAIFSTAVDVIPFSFFLYYVRRRLLESREELPLN